MCRSRKHSDSFHTVQEIDRFQEILNSALDSYAGPALKATLVPFHTSRYADVRSCVPHPFDGDQSLEKTASVGAGLVNKARST